MSSAKLSIAQERQVDEAVDEAMDQIRESSQLTDEVPRSQSLAFLALLVERLAELASELHLERLKHGEGRHAG